VVFLRRYCTLLELYIEKIRFDKVIALSLDSRLMPQMSVLGSYAQLTPRTLVLSLYTLALAPRTPTRSTKFPQTRHLIPLQRRIRHLPIPIKSSNNTLPTTPQATDQTSPSCEIYHTDPQNQYYPTGAHKLRLRNCHRLRRGSGDRNSFPRGRSRCLWLGLSFLCR
jgi:hypothetical protein